MRIFKIKNVYYIGKIDDIDVERFKEDDFISTNKGSYYVFKTFLTDGVIYSLMSSSLIDYQGQIFLYRISDSLLS